MARDRRPANRIGSMVAGVDDKPLVLASALRHGAPEADILPAYRNATFEFADDTGLTTVYCTPVQSGRGSPCLNLGWSGGTA